MGGIIYEKDWLVFCFGVVLTKFVGKLVWNTSEGGFYGVVVQDKDGNTVKYDIGQGIPGIEECLNGVDSIEITGCPQPDMPTTHQWGTPFELMWYKLIDANGVELSTK